MKSFRDSGCVLAMVLGLWLASPLWAQKQFATRSGTATPIGQLSSSFQSIANRVNVSVVKVVAVGYRPISEESGNSLSARQQSGGSGVIISQDGYIVTNAHVVVGAQRLQVIMSSRLDRGTDRQSILKPTVSSARAEIVGVDFETDLALLKIPETALPALKLGDSDAVAPGQIVLAFGSPLGLENSVSMGVVSSAARQLTPEDPMIYIQTDAPINPGNSGGPLVNTDGEVIGINTLIFSQSGGSEGIGFAAPSNIVRNVIEQIQKNGRMVRGEIGVFAQTITPLTAAALGLSTNVGVLLGDVYPGGPAERAALRPGDIVVALNGKPMENARQFMVNLYRPGIGETVSLEVLRGREKLKFPVEVVERKNDPSRFASLVTSAENKIDAFGILGMNLSAKVKELLPPLRKGLGVLVASRTADAPYIEEGFRAGDVIYSVNQIPVINIEELRAEVAKLRPGDPVAVQIERGRQLRYLVFELP